MNAKRIFWYCSVIIGFVLYARTHACIHGDIKLVRFIVHILRVKVIKIFIIYYDSRIHKKVELKCV